MAVAVIETRRRTCALPHQTVHPVKQVPPAFPAFFHILHAIERLYEWASRQPPKAIYTSSQFAWTDALEASWPDILGELAAVLRDRELIPAFQEISPEQRAITQDQKWKTYVLYAYGARANHNCRACPRTAAAVERIPGMKTAFFSILAGGKHIPAHRGPYKGLLRCHLGLIVPGPKDVCRIRVGDSSARSICSMRRVLASSLTCWSRLFTNWLTSISIPGYLE